MCSAFARRKFLRLAVGAAVAAPLLAGLKPIVAAAVDFFEERVTETLEAFADTIVPGAKRHDDDRAIAGVASGPGAVQAGALELLQMPELQLAPLLPGLAALLNTSATGYALRHGVRLPLGAPAFASLPFEHRVSLLHEKFASDRPDNVVSRVTAIVVSMAFDAAAYRTTPDAVRDHHPGLAVLGMPPPNADGFWLYSHYSYGTALALPHPHTTTNGSPA